MARANRATFEKRNRERAQQEKQQEKRALRAQRKERQKSGSDDRTEHEDPDIAGIVPGPQPLPE